MQTNLSFDYATPVKYNIPYDDIINTHLIYLPDYLTNHQESNLNNCVYEDMIGSYTNAFFFGSAYGFRGEDNVQVSKIKGSNTSANVKPFNIKIVRVKWIKEGITLLLSFLKEHKQKELLERGGSGNIKKLLWKRASIVLSDNENQYLPIQHLSLLHAIYVTSPLYVIRVDVPSFASFYVVICGSSDPLL
ncbi:11432_t:CDS:2 [Funneliformis caledonium]|uniref:11432_t:CDS:1 n=1 Tax=Funneliformis caledonium TaxID=1117310 RepID=A0A9N9F767_9GLOM|nr:11432_t:CDS:2 [Funneliformis caledonium]